MRFAQATPYVVAVAVVLLTIGLNQLIHPLLKHSYVPLLFLNAAVMVSAWFGNWRAGLLTLGLSVGAAFYLFPSTLEGVQSTSTYVQVSLLVVEGGLILVFVAALHRARERAESSRRETARSIAQRDETNRTLRSTRARFRRLVEANIIGVFFCEESGQVFEANQAFLSLLGYDDRDVAAAQLNIASITPGEFIDVSVAAAVELARTGHCQPYEKELFHRDGRRIPVLIGSALLSESEGQTVSFALDLTEQKATERELQQAKDEAEKANRLKSDFLANISHELRTPMNAILGMTQLALDEELYEPLREYLKTVFDSGHSLLALVNEILDFSKMEAGRFGLEIAPFSLRELLDETIRSLALQAAEKDLKLLRDVADDVPNNLIGDAQRLRQVLVNLVGNGIKFTPQGQICLAVHVASRTTDEIVLHFDVTDTGIGISPTDQERIFAPFTQVDTSTTRRYGGTGLGLAIASELIRMQGGQLSLRSEQGQGSTFYFDSRFGLATAPIGKPTEGGTSRRELPGLVELPLAGEADHLASFTRRRSPLHVLLAEDTPANRNVVRSILQKRGHQVSVAADGRQAVEAVEREAFDVVLMDVQMPEMDGLQATAAIRAKERGTEHPLPIIALTAHAMKGDRQRCLAAGMNAYLAKPIDAFKLIELVESLVDGNMADEDTALDASSLDISAPSDETRRLADEGAPVNDPRSPSPAERSADSPDHDSPQEFDVRKPARRPVDDSIPADVEASATYDLQAALRRLGNRPSLLQDMIGFFLEDAPVLLAEIHQGLSTADAASTCRAAHSLKGLAANFDATETTSAALGVEQFAQQGQWDEVRPLLTKLEHETTQLIAALKRELARM